ncbi:MAG: sel1 repeat family protein [Magnetococcales bacterium]|nr:sel1 repeat family protein [Magnetococcales bacterium]
MFKVPALLLLLTLLPCTPALSAEYEKVQSLNETIRAANQGVIDAQNTVAMIYRDGLGVPRDYKAAIKWYRMAAEKGHAEAQYHLGMMFHDGKGIAKDDREALRWFRQAADQGVAEAQFALWEVHRRTDGPEARKWLRQAADQGLAEAQYHLGIALRDGEAGLEKEPQQAASWLRKAADQEFAKAQTALAGLLATGQGVEKNPVEAAVWLNLAISQGDPAALKKRAQLHKEMTPEQITQAGTLAEQWSPPALPRIPASQGTQSTGSPPPQPVP